jgi:hypothetical protein
MATGGYHDVCNRRLLLPCHHLFLAMTDWPAAPFAHQHAFACLHASCATQNQREGPTRDRQHA